MDVGQKLSSTLYQEPSFIPSKVCIYPALEASQEVASATTTASGIGTQEAASATTSTSAIALPCRFYSPNQQDENGTYSSRLYSPSERAPAAFHIHGCFRSSPTWKKIPQLQELLFSSINKALETIFSSLSTLQEPSSAFPPTKLS
ncbi:hypothetical protein Nepgr_016464 [Nepenthes gracilis]|uniref:Uncharacterized protein n=1 Tax=Nepenthes gracilis TaxID=150966 RepID=A0AAD3XRN0_NEPGR|nr:hypothetical protein Nepgr_016464 [Nepenthes gracilis]